VYLIWYGTWNNNADNTAVQLILTDFLSDLGGSPYFQINAIYPNNIGGAPSGALLYYGADIYRYSHGLQPTASDIAAIVENQLVTGRLPQDPSGYLCVLASADVTSNATGFCARLALAHHGTTYSTANGARANLKLGTRDFLIQQNWVIARREHCAMNSSL
jgi:hypothetical protein